MSETGWSRSAVIVDSYGEIYELGILQISDAFVCRNSGSAVWRSARGVASDLSDRKSDQLDGTAYEGIVS